MHSAFLLYAVVRTFLTSNLTWCSNLSFGVIIRVESEAFQVSISMNQNLRLSQLKLRLYVIIISSFAFVRFSRGFLTDLKLYL
jgi:hypothetical protein